MLIKEMARVIGGADDEHQDIVIFADGDIYLQPKTTSDLDYASGAKGRDLLALLHVAFEDEPLTTAEIDLARHKLGLKDGAVA